MSFLPKGYKPKGKAPQFKTTTVRQFDGGWNVIDSEFNITPRFASIFDNVVRGPDGSVSVRYGNELWRDTKLGLQVDVTPPGGATIQTFNLSKRLQFNWTGHGFTTGEHYTTDSFGGSLGGHDLTQYNGKYFSVRVINANTFDVILKTAATADASASFSITGKRDTHASGGNLINGHFFGGYMIVVSEAGEVFAITTSGTLSRIWDNGTAYALDGNPAGWSLTDFVSFNVFGGRMQIHNGVDKPIEVDFTRTPVVQFLGDPAAGGSNAAVPIGYYSTNSANYSVIGGKPDEPTELSVSGKLSAGVYAGNPDPDDAADFDMGKVSNTSDAKILGLIELRNKLLIAFRDAVTVGSLGKVTPTTIGAETINVHEPDFTDTIAQHGTVSHRTMVSLGNDVLMADRVGIPSVAQSEQSGQFVPRRVSELIEPALQLNMSRLSDTTLEKKAFAVYNSRDKQYMLFIPKYDVADVRPLEEDPISLVTDLGSNKFVVNVAAHGFEVGDEVSISNIGLVGSNSGANFNGVWAVHSVIDADHIIIENTAYSYPELNVTGGGTLGTIQPINKGVIGYVLTYNPKLKVKAWSRFTGLDFDWCCKSVNGRLFFGKGGKIYQFGTTEYPFAADYLKDYDSRGWTASTFYGTGFRVQDGNKVYQSLTDHTSSTTGDFAGERTTYPDRWGLYEGKPIKFTWEWPWGDFDKRLNTKAIRAVMPDVGGTGKFFLRIFNDLLYKNKNTGSLIPSRTLEFIAGDSGGFGSGPQPYGGGRRTKEQLYWPVPVNGKLHKFRIEGETTDPLRFIAFSIVYHEGTLKSG